MEVELEIPAQPLNNELSEIEELFKKYDASRCDKYNE